MKSVLKILIAAALIVFCFAGCSNIPDEPPVTSIEKHTYQDPYGMTAPVAENIEDYPGMTQPLYYVATDHEIEVVQNSYYVYGNTVATIEDLVFDYAGTGFALRVSAFADVKISAKGRSDDEMKIGYTAYDEEGNVLDESAITVDISEMEDGDMFEDAIVQVPVESVKVVFHDYEE